MTEKFRIVYPDAEKADEIDFRQQLERLREVADLTIHCDRPKTAEEYIQRIKDAEGILLGWDLPVEVMSQAEQLKVISFLGIGVRQFVDLNQAKLRNITVSNCPGYADTAVAEQTLALLLACAKNIPLQHARVQKGEWADQRMLTELSGKTIGLVGFGGIGKRVAKLCHAFGMRVLVWTRSMNIEYEKQYEIELCELEKLYSHSDIISLHVAESEDTQNMINHHAFDAMKPGVIFINTARAQLVDQLAFIEALDSQKISTAGIDVFHQEPVTCGDPLLNRDNVILSPHVGFNTAETTVKQVEIAVSNLIQYIKGDPINIVEP